jgi:hypothetical protein
MQNIVPIHELENRMRPGAYSVKGFLGEAESLEEILRQDELTLQQLDLTYEKLAAELETLISDALQQKHERVYKNRQELMEREYPSNIWQQARSMSKFSTNDLPSTQIGYIIGNKYQGFFAQTRGFQECPWNCEQPEWGSFEFLLLNRETAEFIIVPGLIVHLIREHRFFEGRESPYRVEPFKLAQVLGLVS